MLPIIKSVSDPADIVVFYDRIPLCEPEGATGRAEVVLHVRRRFANELCLLRVQWLMLLLCLTVIVYGSLMLFRNLAFYRFRAGARLTQDLGFDWLPEWQGYLTDSPMVAFQLVLIGACVMCFVPRPTRLPASYAVNMIQRWGMMIGMGNTLRFLTYISTTLPGSAKHCLPSNPNIVKDQPKTSDILFRITLPGVPGPRSCTSPTSRRRFPATGSRGRTTAGI